MSTDDRTTGTLHFDIADRKVAVGEEFEVEFHSTDRVLGYQFTLVHTGLQVVEIMPGAGMRMDNFMVHAAKSALTTVVEDAAPSATFTVRFRATQGGTLSKILQVSSAITKAVSYATESERHAVELRFNNGIVSGLGFELYQNTPNPFASSTIIGFHLPEAATVTLTVHDELGRVLHTQKADMAKGQNRIALDKNKLTASGMMYYTISTNQFTATRQMLRIE
jgi:hypothetical protein